MVFLFCIGKLAKHCTSKYAQQKCSLGWEEAQREGDRVGGGGDRVGGGSEGG